MQIGSRSYESRTTGGSFRVRPTGSEMALVSASQSGDGRGDGDRKRGRRAPVARASEAGPGWVGR